MRIGRSEAIPRIALGLEPAIRNVIFHNWMQSENERDIVLKQRGDLVLMAIDSDKNARHVVEGARTEDLVKIMLRSVEHHDHVQVQEFVRFRCPIPQ